MKKIELLPLLALVLSIPIALISASDQKPFYVINGANNEKMGLVRIMYTVLKVLDEYEKGDCSGVSLSYSNDGKYYSHTRGPNWWEYYCEPLSVGDVVNKNSKKLLGYQKAIMLWHSRFEMSPLQKHLLFKKYITILPYLIERANAVITSLNGVPLIGLFYENPGGLTPQSPVAYEEVYDALITAKAQFPEECKIFMVSNDPDFFEFMHSRMASCLVTLNCPAVKSCEDQNKTLEGEIELLIPLILSRVDLLLRTTTEMAEFASVINPDLPVITLGENWLTKI